MMARICSHCVVAAIVLTTWAQAAEKDILEAIPEHAGVVVRCRRPADTIDKQASRVARKINPALVRLLGQWANPGMLLSQYSTWPLAGGLVRSTIAAVRRFFGIGIP